METKKNVKNNEVANEVKNVVRSNATVIGVRVIKNAGAENRVIIDLDCKPFESIKPNGEIIDTTSFSKDTIALTMQIGSFIPELQLATTLAMGQRINPQIIALALMNAKIDIVREFKAAGEARATGNENDVYSNDAYTTTITKVVPNVNDLNRQMIMMLIQTQLTTAVTTTTTTTTKPNPFAL